MGTVEKMLQNHEKRKEEQLRESGKVCHNTFCDGLGREYWKQHPMSSGFHVCTDCYAILSQ